jgi:hypothetical protein
MAESKIDARLIDLASPTQLMRRKELKKHPLVTKAIDRFWFLLLKNKFGCLSQQVYMEFSVRLYKIINVDFVYNDAFKTAQDDWLRESQHQQSMSYNMFFDSLFELADIWCPDISAASYATFLEKVRI